MNVFSSDLDVVKVEAGVFWESGFSGQVACRGANGVLSGTLFSAAGESFIAKGVAAGGVIFLQSLDGVINAAYEIVSVVSETQLVVSVVRADALAPVVPIGAGSGLVYRVATFAPQAVMAAAEITGALGIRPGTPDGVYGVEHIADTGAMRPVSVYRVLAMIFGAMAGVEDTKKTYAQKRDYYMGLYRLAFRRMCIVLEGRSDGLRRRVLHGGTVECLRD